MRDWGIEQKWMSVLLLLLLLYNGGCHFYLNFLHSDSELTGIVKGALAPESPGVSKGSPWRKIWGTFPGPHVRQAMADAWILKRHKVPGE